MNAKQPSDRLLAAVRALCTSCRRSPDRCSCSKGAQPPRLDLGAGALRVQALAGPARERAFAELLKQAGPFLRTCVRRFRGDDVAAEDLEQAAALGFHLAVKDFRPEAGDFRGFAKWKIRGELARVLRVAQTIRGVRDLVELDAPKAPELEDEAAAPDELEAIFARFGEAGTLGAALRAIAAAPARGVRLELEERPRKCALRVLGVDDGPASLLALLELVGRILRRPGLPFALLCAQPETETAKARLAGPGRRLVWGADEWGLEFPACYLELVPQRALARAASRLAKDLDERQRPGPDADFVTKFRAVLLELLPTGPQIGQVAQRFEISAATLKRRLAAEGTSFRDELVSLRLELGRKFLAAGDRPEVVAARLGYRSSHRLTDLAARAGELKSVHRRKIAPLQPIGLADRPREPAAVAAKPHKSA